MDQQSIYVVDPQSKPFLMVAQLIRLTMKDFISIERIAEKKGQGDERPHQNHHQGFWRTGGFDDRQLLRHDIGIKEKGERHNANLKQANR